MHFSSKLFLMSTDRKALLTDMSMLDQGGTREVFHKVYSDSCDDGIIVSSEKTGNLVEYVVDNVKCDAEGEIVSWELVPTRTSIATVPACKGVKVVIFND